MATKKATTFCLVEDCGIRCSLGRKYCLWHHRHWLECGNPGPVRVKVVRSGAPKRLPPLCAVDGCGKKCRAVAWCGTHHKRWKLYGDPVAPRKERQKQKKRLRPQCQTVGCESNASSRLPLCVSCRRKEKYRERNPKKPRRTWRPDFCRVLDLSAIPNWPASEMGVIYLIEHIASGFRYVGQTIRTIECRWGEHCSVRSSSSTYRLKKAIAKYGKDAFSIKELERAHRSQLNQLEQKWIAFYDCFSPKGYNLTAGGLQYTTVSDETKEKIRQAQWRRLSNEQKTDRLYRPLQRELRLLQKEIEALRELVVALVPKRRKKHKQHGPRTPEQCAEQSKRSRERWAQLSPEAQEVKRHAARQRSAVRWAALPESEKVKQRERSIQLIAAMTPEQRELHRERGRLAGIAWWQSLTDEQRTAHRKKSLAA